MSESVCCPNCWSWSELGRRTTCRKCGAPLILASGQTVADAVAPSPVPAIAPGVTYTAASALAPPPPPPPPPQFSAGPVTGASPPGTPAPRHRVRRAVAGVAVVAVVLAGAAGVLAYRFMSGSADSLVTMVPSSAGLYVNINLDPPGDQKLAVHDLLSRFPQLGDQSQTASIAKWLDQSLSGVGLNFTSDVSPWLGSEISIEASADAFSGLVGEQTSATTSAFSSGSAGVLTATATPPDFAILLPSNGDDKAQAMLDKLKNGPFGKSLAWTTGSDGGVAVTSTGDDNGFAFAIVNHTVVLSATASAIDAVIDTAQGRDSGLQTSSSFTTVESQLPASRIGLMYVDVHAAFSKIFSSLGKIPGASAQLDMLKAYRGAGLALVASSDGIAVDGTLDFDPSQLTADQRASVTMPAHVNSSLAFMPATAYGMYALAGMQPALRGGLSTVAPAGSQLDHMLQQLGLTGINGLINHLTGDAGLEVDKGATGGTPSGALLIGTDSSAAAQSFMTSLLTTACGQTSLCSASSVTTQVDHGVTVSTVALTGVDGVAPSWAVSDGMLIIGSTPAEVRAVIDGHASGATITTAPGFQAVASHVSTTNNGMFYLDVPAVLAALRATMPAGVKTSFDHGPGQYLAHVGAIGMSSQAFSDHSTFTLFATIK